MAFNAGQIGGFDPKGVKKNFKHQDMPEVQAQGNETVADPTESLQLGFAPLQDSKVDAATVGGPNSDIAATQAKGAGAASSMGVPSLLTNADLNSGLNQIKTGLTGVNRLGSATITDMSGNVIASVNPLVPTSPTRRPSTSLTTFGLEDTQFVTSSGRVIDGNPSVKMPTTHLGLVNGLESRELVTTGGRVITL